MIRVSAEKQEITFNGVKVGAIEITYPKAPNIMWELDGMKQFCKTEDDMKIIVQAMIDELKEEYARK